jgi:hypothetical protein
MVTAGVVAFGLLLRPYGLAIATLTLVTLSSFAGREFSILRVVLLSAGLVVLCYFIFVYLLTLPLSLWPG